MIGLIPSKMYNSVRGVKNGKILFYSTVGVVEIRFAADGKWTAMRLLFKNNFLYAHLLCLYWFSSKI